MRNSTIFTFMLTATIILFSDQAIEAQSCRRTKSCDTPECMTLKHFDQCNGRTFYYKLTAGDNSWLKVYRPGKLLHEADYIGTDSVNGKTYFRYRIYYTSDTAPNWAIRATNDNRYEIYIPISGCGTILYSDNRGRSFVDESDVPPAGYAKRQ